MPRHDVPVSRGRRFMASARRPMPATGASGRTSLPPSACRTDSPGPGRSPGGGRRGSRRGLSTPCASARAPWSWASSTMWRQTVCLSRSSPPPVTNWWSTFSSTNGKCCSPISDGHSAPTLSIEIAMLCRRNRRATSTTRSRLSITSALSISIMSPPNAGCAGIGAAQIAHRSVIPQKRNRQVDREIDRPLLFQQDSANPRWRDRSRIRTALAKMRIVLVAE